jgi:hypothetical protein
LFSSPSEDGDTIAPSSVSPFIILSYLRAPSLRQTSQTKVQNVADRHMMLPYCYPLFLTSSNGRFSLVTSESHKITLSMNWKLFVQAKL